MSEPILSKKNCNDQLILSQLQLYNNNNLILLIIEKLFIFKLNRFVFK